MYKYFTHGCPAETGRWVAKALQDTLKIYSGHLDSCGVPVKYTFYKGNNKYEINKPAVAKPKPDPGKKITGNEIMSDQVVKDGFNKVYDSKRRVLMEGTFKDGKLVSGKWYRYDGKGSLTKIEIWKEGKYASDEKIITE